MITTGFPCYPLRINPPRKFQQPRDIYGGWNSDAHADTGNMWFMCGTQHVDIIFF